MIPDFLSYFDLQNLTNFVLSYSPAVSIILSVVKFPTSKQVLFVLSKTRSPSSLARASAAPTQRRTETTDAQRNPRIPRREKYEFMLKQW